MSIGYRIKERIKKSARTYGIFLKIRNFISRFIKPKFLYLLFYSKKPISNKYGLDRGRPVDRYYIEEFLSHNSKYITGRILEVLDNNYTKKYGKRVSVSDILDIDPQNKNATIVGDLRNLHAVKDDWYDCIILTQVLQYVDDCRSAVKECQRILKPGGVLLVTVPSASRIDCISGVSGDFWRFTCASIKYIFQDIFGNGVIIESAGNFYATMNYLIGAAVEDLDKNNLFVKDENFPCVIMAVAVK